MNTVDMSSWSTEKRAEFESECVSIERYVMDYHKTFGDRGVKLKILGALFGKRIKNKYNVTLRDLILSDLKRFVTILNEKGGIVVFPVRE